jgi:hypothetical protein
MAKAPELVRYLVVVDALTLTVGRTKAGKPVVERMRHGQGLNAAPDNEQVMELLAAKAIVEATPENVEKIAKGRRLTVKGSARAQGGEEPLAPVVKDVLPIDAPLPDTAPAL